MAKIKNKRNIQAKNNKLKTLNNLRMCKIVLHNIALDRNLVQLYQLHFSEKKTVELEHSSPCINTSKKSSNNVWMLKENMRQDNTENGTFRLTRSRSKKLMKKINEECKNVEFLDDISYSRIIRPGEITGNHILPTAQKQQLKHDSSVKSFSSKSNDKTSQYTFSNMENCNHTHKKIISINNKKHRNNKKSNTQKDSKLGNCKRKLQFSESGNTHTHTHTHIFILYYVLCIKFCFAFFT